MYLHCLHKHTYTHILQTVQTTPLHMTIPEEDAWIQSDVYFTIWYQTMSSLILRERGVACTYLHPLPHRIAKQELRARGEIKEKGKERQIIIRRWIAWKRIFKMIILCDLVTQHDNCKLKSVVRSAINYHRNMLWVDPICVLWRKRNGDRSERWKTNG